jgi:hypothetical protein
MNARQRRDWLAHFIATNTARQATEAAEYAAVAAVREGRGR